MVVLVVVVVVVVIEVPVVVVALVSVVVVVVVIVVAVVVMEVVVFLLWLLLKASWLERFNTPSVTPSESPLSRHGVRQRGLCTSSGSIAKTELAHSPTKAKCVRQDYVRGLRPPV